MDSLGFVWALAVLPSLGQALAVVGTIVMSAMALVWVITQIEDVREKTERSNKVLMKWLFPAGFVCFVLGWSLPTNDNLIKAYLMVEGSKVITAENADKAATEIISRVDRVMDHYFLEGKAEEPADSKRAALLKALKAANIDTGKAEAILNAVKD